MAVLIGATVFYPRERIATGALELHEGVVEKFYWDDRGKQFAVLKVPTHTAPIYCNVLEVLPAL